MGPKIEPCCTPWVDVRFTLDWSFKPHSDEDCEGGIMVVFWGEMMLAEKE